MCGENAQCYTSLQEIEIRNYSEGICDRSKCSFSFDRVFPTCKRQRGPEVCEKITQYYNPLYLGGEIDSNGIPLNFACDDEKGKHIGTYQCLGNYLYIRRISE